MTVRSHLGLLDLLGEYNERVRDGRMISPLMDQIGCGREAACTASI